MCRTAIYILIFGLFYLIFNHFLLSTKEGLDNQCSTSVQDGCKNIAIAKNTKAAAYTKTLLKNAMEEILALIKKLSKLIKTKNTELNANSDNIALNLKHVGKMNDALKPTPKKK